MQDWNWETIFTDTTTTTIFNHCDAFGKQKTEIGEKNVKLGLLRR